MKKRNCILLITGLMALLLCAFSVSAQSTEKDPEPDPASEQLSCLGAAPAWALYGEQGFTGSETPLSVNERSNDGHIAYYKRTGRHFLGYPDWVHFMDFIKMNLKK